MRLPTVRVAVLLAVVLVAVSACSDDGTSGQESEAPAVTEELSLTGELDSGAAWAIRVPKAWNGTLVLYSHGFVALGRENVTELAPSEHLGEVLLAEGYALAGSSFSSTGWAVDDALVDQVALLDEFAERVGAPTRTLAWGTSLGGLITVGLLEERPDRFDGGMAMCAPLSGATTWWDSLLDTVLPLSTLLVPDVDLPLVRLSEADEPLQRVEEGEAAYDRFGTAARGEVGTRAGLARTTLAAAFSGLTWPEGTPSADWQRELFSIAYYGIRHRVELEHRFGGSPSTNVGVDYAALLDASGRRTEVEAAYVAAGLDLSADLSTLAAAPRVKADAAARARLTGAYETTGALEDPLVTLHTTGDPLVVFGHESAYDQRVAAQGTDDLLRQAAVERTGHCAITPAEHLAVFYALADRVESGAWPSLSATQLDASSEALGAALNARVAGPATLPLGPDFVEVDAPSFPRAALTTP